MFMSRETETLYQNSASIFELGYLFESVVEMAGGNVDTTVQSRRVYLMLYEIYIPTDNLYTIRLAHL